MNIRTITDKEFGIVSLHERSTARHLIFRVKQGRLAATIPPHTRTTTVKETNENGVPVSQDSAFLYTVTGEGNVTLSTGENTGTIHITNSLGDSDGYYQEEPSTQAPASSGSNNSGNNGSSGTSGGTNRSSRSGKTGDNNQILLYAGLLAAAVIVGSVVVVRRRRR